MTSVHHFAINALQSLDDNYHEVCHNYLPCSAISAIVCGKGFRLQGNRSDEGTCTVCYGSICLVYKIGQTYHYNTMHLAFLATI